MEYSTITKQARIDIITNHLRTAENQHYNEDVLARAATDPAHKKAHEDQAEGFANQIKVLRAELATAQKIKEEKS